MELGFLCRYVPGVSCSIVSRKVISTYFFNLGHRQLTQAPGFQVFSHWTDECSSRWFQYHADRLRNGVMAATKSLNSASVTSRPVLRFLWGQRPEVFVMLQLLLSRYASHLLSRHWSRFGAPAGHVIDELRLMICGDLRKPAPTSPADAECGVRDWQAIIEHFCELALELAEEYMSRFEQVSQVFFDWLDLCVIPVPAERGYDVITLLVLESVEQGGLVLGYESVGGVASFTHEADLPLEQLYALDLLAPPRAGRQGTGHFLSTAPIL
ncbi:hypothetical protein ACI77I_28610 [Pseudomonas sp. D47]|uniref:hypothetical protein n=1 Tax=Pseudomonas sp. D47 TaxID=3159447 RepID=UPI00387B641F